MNAIGLRSSITNTSNTYTMKWTETFSARSVVAIVVAMIVAMIVAMVIAAILSIGTTDQ